VQLYRQPTREPSGEVDPRLVAQMEALCARAAALASQAAALTHEAAQLRAAAESTLRLLPGANAKHLQAVPLIQGSPLSPRQLEVADLVAAGLSNRQIGERLVVTERTVETHLERIFARLEIQSRAQLARWVTEQELLDHGSRSWLRSGG